MERRLAAILAMDVVGFSRLIEADETGTLERQKAHRDELIDPSINQFRGHIVKTTGDGLLAEFASVVDAVQCAVAIQDGMSTRDVDAPEDTRIRFRIAVHLGDIIFEDGDFFGDGVNIAARLEGLADPGGIVVSGEAHDQLKTKAGVRFRSLGTKQLKNISVPVRVFTVDGPAVRPTAPRRPRWRMAGAAVAVALLLVAGGYWWSTGPDFTPADTDQMTYALADKPSVAVMPFAQVGDAPEQGVLRDGLTADLTASLSRARTFLVIASATTMTYKDKIVTPAQVAEELGVRYVVLGTIQLANEQLRITVELVDALAGNVVWAERYEKTTADFFEIQNDMSRQIAGIFSGEYGVVAQAVLDRAKRASPEDLRAYELTLMAKEVRERFDKENNQESLALLTQAVELDPDFAGAHIGLAWTYAQEFLNEWRTIDADVALNKSIDSAKHALSLDPQSANAYYVLGSMQLWGLGALDEAVASFERALELEPNNADLLMIWGGWVLPELGRYEEGMRIAQNAIRLNPYHGDWYYGGLSWASFGAGAYEEAVKFHRANKYPSTDQTAVFVAALALAGEIDEASAEAANLLEVSPDISAAAYADWLFHSKDMERRLREGLLLAGLPD